MIGKFEELGLFVSGLASLPRIVTVHDVKISPVGGGRNEGIPEKMIMDVTVKTYNEGSEEDAVPTKKTRGKGR